MDFSWTIVVLVIALGLTWRFLGSYMAAVFEGRVHYLAWAERPFYRLLGTGPDHEQTWKRYAELARDLLRRFRRRRLSAAEDSRVAAAQPAAPRCRTSSAQLQHDRVVHDQHELAELRRRRGDVVLLPDRRAHGRSSSSSAAVGIAVAIAMVRGFSRRNSPTIGNFWVDITRCMLYILLPIVFLAGIVIVGQGAVQTLAGPVSIHDALNGVTQTIPRGPAGFMGSIMQIGTNGGGFFDVDLAHPFENPTALTNLLYIWLTLSIPFSLTYTFGKMVKSIRHGVALLVVMVIIFGSWVAFTSYSEHQNNPAVVAAGVHSTIGNTEGKEVRFGDTTSALFNVTMTQTSDGAVDSATDSYNPMGGFGPLTGMMLGEVTPGGVGSGLYTLLIYAIIAVFIGGLMIGRTPEFLGKKIQAKEVKLAGLGALVMPIIVLVLTAIAVSIHAGRAGPLNSGPHGFTEILYAFTSQANNNGSAMAGLAATPPSTTSSGPSTC